MSFYRIIFLFFFTILACKEPVQLQLCNASSLPEMTENLKPVVFIAGYDDGSNWYYTQARSFFKKRKMIVVDHLFSLEEIILWLNRHQDNGPYGQIHIVSHGNPWRGMSLKTTKNGERITTKNLGKALELKALPVLEGGILHHTKLVFHSCGLGSNEPLMKQLKMALSSGGASPQIVASPFFNIFGGKYASHYLAKPYYGYYPTAESPGLLTLAKEFKSDYPETGINWLETLKTREEQAIGGAYTYKFNIPVNWKFTFDSDSAIPRLNGKEDIMDWLSDNEEVAAEFLQLNIPLEKFRWRSKVEGNTLVIFGKTTVLCVMQPVMSDTDAYEYRPISLEDSELYRIL